MISVFLAAAYCIVDLSAGPLAKTAAVTYRDAAPEGGWGDEYRLTKLVLRRIEAEPAYFIGVFEVTQRQYELVMGKRPSIFKGDMRPVECVAWEDLRGQPGKYPWPETTEVSDESFVGRLRARTQLAFDLPSERQWETAAFSAAPGRWQGTRSDGRGGFAEHTRVGSYEPNGRGLYDLLGNVWEWCLDGKNGNSRSAYRAIRGGCWSGGVETCSVGYRSSFMAARWGTEAYIGFRLALNPGVSPTPQPASAQASQKSRPPCPNPIAPEGKFLADPAGRVGPDGTLHLFCSHDESPTAYCSRQNDVLSTADLTNWSLNEGVFRSASKTGLDVNTPLYAPDAIFYDGKWRLFYCTPYARHAEGVAEAASPKGPFGRAHRLEFCRQIDPSVFLDDDGSLYLYWGQFTAKCAKLRKDLSGFEPGSERESIVDAQHHGFHEGSQAFKRNGIYYLAYTDISRGGCTCIGYSTASTPFGPFTYRGVIIDNRGCDPCCNNNHGSVVEFNGRWYVFYHRQSNGVASLRKACAEPIEFDSEGLIREVEMTSSGAGAPLDPFRPTEGRLACLLSGNVRVTTLPDGHERLTGVRSGDTAIWRYFDFARPSSEMEVTCIPEAGGRIAALDASGAVMGACEIAAGDGQTPFCATIPLERPIPRSCRQVKLRFEGEKGRDLLQLEKFLFR